GFRPGTTLVKGGVDHVKDATVDAMRCTIVPPHVLERVLERTDDPEIRARARRSLVIDAGNRVERRLSLFAAPSPAPGPAEANRTIKDAKNHEELPGETVRAEGAP